MAANYKSIIKGFTKTIKLCEARVEVIKTEKAKQRDIVRVANAKETELHTEQIQVNNLLTNLNKLLG